MLHLSNDGNKSFCPAFFKKLAESRGRASGQGCGDEVPAHQYFFDTKNPLIE